MATKRARTRTRSRSARGSIQTSSRTRIAGETEEKVSETSKEFQEKVQGDPGYVGVTAGLTKNLGDFNSCKVSVTVTLPFTDEGDDSVRAAHERASALADEFMDIEYRKAIGEDQD